MDRPSPAFSWINTGRFSPAPKRERLRDLVELGACLKRGEPVPPLLARWLCAAIDALDDQLADGGRPNLHRLLELPERPYRRAERKLRRFERDLAIGAIAQALPGNLAPWPRAARTLALLTDTTAPATGDLAMLRAELLGPLPRSQRSIHRIIVATADKCARDMASVNPPPVKRPQRGKP